MVLQNYLHAFNDVITSLVLMLWLIYTLINDCKFPWSISLVSTSQCYMEPVLAAFGDNAKSLLQAFNDAITSGICITSPHRALTVKTLTVFVNVQSQYIPLPPLHVCRDVVL